MRPNSAESCEREEASKNVRMSLHVLQHAATDKENLVGPGRTAVGGERNKSMIENEKKMNDNLPKGSLKKKKITKVPSEESSKKIVTAVDVTSEEPSEVYWKQLAETRRVALEEALVENETLSQKIELLEQENALTKEMLNEARNLIEVLNEIIDQNDNVEDAEEIDESVNQD